jgi:hypothetical protein
VPIEHFALRIASDQVLKFLLAVNLDEQFRKLRERLEWHHLAVDISPRSAVHGDHAAQQHLAVVLDGLAVEPRARTRRQIDERRRRFGPLRALAHVALACTAAGEHDQGVDDQGLAGAGFAGQCREPRPEVERRLLDDHEIAQLQMSQHGWLMMRFDARCAAAPVQLRA